MPFSITALIDFFCIYINSNTNVILDQTGAASIIPFTENGDGTIGPTWVRQMVQKLFSREGIVQKAPFIS